jgi:hypothetical protein
MAALIPPRQPKSQGAFKPSIEGGDDEEGLDLDYSYSHLDEFLRSQRGAGSLIAPTSIIPGKESITSKAPISVGHSAAATTTQQLMNTFLTSYQKNKGSVRSSNI